MFELTTDQRTLIDMVDDWYHSSYKHASLKDQVFVYSGYPGTGKTFILNFIMDRLNLDWSEVIFCAFTGKAASNLCKQGFNACTIHSAFFDLIEVPKIKDGKLVTNHGRPVTELRFREKSEISPNIKLIIIDEWGTVNEDLAKAMMKHGIPIIAAGDADQLPPVTGESPFASMIQFYLKQIMRQASYSGIIQLSNLLREGGDIPVYKNFFNDAWVMPKEFLTEKHLEKADTVLTVKNKTREMFNDKIRIMHGSYGKLPCMGDKLICRKNNWNLSLEGIPLINGTVGKVYAPVRRSECDLSAKHYRIDFQPDYAYGTDFYYESLECDYEFLNEPCGNKEINLWDPSCKLEYAEAITVMLSQGSQYSNVIYYDEFCKDREFMRKVRYTACTRAIDKFIMFI